MGIVKMVVILISVVIFSPNAWSAEYWAKKSDQLIGIDFIKQAEENLNRGVKLVIYVSPEDLRLAKKIIKEYLQCTPKDNPFYPDLVENMRMLNNKSIAPDVQRVLSLSFAEQGR